MPHPLKINFLQRWKIARTMYGFCTPAAVKQPSRQTIKQPNSQAAYNLILKLKHIFQNSDKIMNKISESFAMPASFPVCHFGKKQMYVNTPVSLSP